MLLGSFSLDLFAVLISGVLALLPVFARDVLHTEAWGLGLLRSSPAIGALTMSVVLANYPLRGPVGRHLFRRASPSMALASAMFGLSQSLVLSMAGAGAARRRRRHQRRHPRLDHAAADAGRHLRGRVTAAFSMFTGTSNQLGEFRAGALAAAIGAVPAVLIGGLSTVAVAGIGIWLFPQLWRMRRLDGS